MSPRELTCQQMVELVTDYLEGRLSRRERRRFERHLVECDGCTRYLEQIRVTIRLLGRLEERHISRDARHELLEAFRDWNS